MIKKIGLMFLIFAPSIIEAMDDLGAESRLKVYKQAEDAKKDLRKELMWGVPMGAAVYGVGSALQHGSERIRSMLNKNVLLAMEGRFHGSPFYWGSWDYAYRHMGVTGLGFKIAGLGILAHQALHSLEQMRKINEEVYGQPLHFRYWGRMKQINKERDAQLKALKDSKLK